MSQFLHRWNDLPLFWRIVTSPVIAAALILWAFPILHALPPMIATALLALSSSGYIDWLPLPQFIFSVSLPYIILFAAGFITPVMIILDAVKKTEHSK